MTECPECGNTYKHIGKHWMYKESHRPPIDDKNMQILKGMLMSDSILRARDGNPYLVTEMINKEYLTHIDDKFGALSNGVIQKRSAKESAENARKNGLDENADTDNYSTTYNLRVVAHPQLKNLLDFYQSGEKIWPKKLELTPLILKHLYCGDGSLEQGSENYYRISISLQNEGQNKEKINSYFRSADLPAPDNWKSIKQDGKKVVKSARWNGDNTEELLSYMGSPPPGFEYKWPQ